MDLSVSPHCRNYLLLYTIDYIRKVARYILEFYKSNVSYTQMASKCYWRRFFFVFSSLISFFTCDPVAFGVSIAFTNVSVQVTVCVSVCVCIYELSIPFSPLDTNTHTQETEETNVCKMPMCGPAV